MQTTILNTVRLKNKETMASTDMEILREVRLLLLCNIFLGTSIVRLALRHRPAKKYRLVQQDEGSNTEPE